MNYFYTYKLPFNQDKGFDYWHAESADYVLDLACAKYNTVDFCIEKITKQAYWKAIDNSVSVNEGMKIALRSGKDFAIANRNTGILK